MSTPPKTWLSPAVRERWLMGTMIGLSFLFALVPDSLSINSLVADPSHTIAGGSGVRQVEYGSIFALALWAIWRAGPGWRVLLRTLNPGLIALLLYCAFSAYWSLYPSITLKRSIVFAGLVLTGIAISPPVGKPHAAFRYTLATCTVVLILSFFVAILWPSAGLDVDLGNAWRGITWQKNTLGSVAAVSVLLWVRECFRPGSAYKWDLAGILFSLFVLFMTQSATAKLVMGLSVITFLAARRQWLDRRSTAIVALCLTLVVLYALLAASVLGSGFPGWHDLISPVTALFHKSNDLTGRDAIWSAAKIAIAQHPVWGTGYGAFWVGDGGPAEFVKRLLGWMPSNSHNGYLDILNELGGVGLALFIAAVLWQVGALCCLFRIDRDDAAMHAALLVVILIGNFSETQLLSDTVFENLLFIYSLTDVSGRLVHERMRRAQARAVVQPAAGVQSW